MIIESVSKLAYRELPAKFGSKYRFELLEDFSVRVDRQLGNHSFRDDRGTEWLNLNGNTITVRKFYNWNGSSPKIAVAGKWFGTPDTPTNLGGSVVHDALYQYLSADCFPLSQEDANAIFYNLMKLEGFALSGVYFGAVATLGYPWKFFGDFFKKTPECYYHGD
jgi:hypothetical protein